jgi:hypothetical protein
MWTESNRKVWKKELKIMREKKESERNETKKRQGKTNIKRR